MNVNTVQLEQVLAGRQLLPVTQVSPIDTPDAESMTAWLEPLPACELLLSDGESFEPVPSPTRTPSTRRRGPRATPRPTRAGDCRTAASSPAGTARPARP